MSTLEYRLKDPTYKNWVKAGFCLNLLKEGLEEYADIKSKEFHNAVLASVAKLKTHQKSVCDNERITFDNNNRGTITCKHTFCQGFLNAVVHIGIDPTQKYTIRKGNIDNCDVKLWSTDPWELAKLFMNPGQTPSQRNPGHTDLSGILNFLQHCQVPRKGVQNIQNVEKVRKTRNLVMHTPDMKVSPAMFQTDTQTMLDLLRDPKLAKFSSAKLADSAIQKVIQADFQFLLEDEIKVIKNWIVAVEKVTNDTKTEIRELRKECSSMQQTGDEEKKTLQTQIKQMEEETNKMSDSLAALTKRVSDDKTLQERIGLEVKKIHGSLEQAKKDLWNAHNELKRQVKETEHKIIDAAQERKVLYDLHAKMKLKTSASISDLSVRQANTESWACEMKRRQDDIEQKVIFAALERMALYDRQTKMESQVEDIRPAAIGDEDCRKLRKSLVKEYSRLYKDISLSPFGEELNDDALRVPIDKIYCDLDIVKIKGNKQPKSARDSLFKKDIGFYAYSPIERFRNRDILNSYSEMFADTEIKNIVIKGEGGTGKSTWCKRLLHAWCQVQRRELGMEGASDEANSDMEESLKRFDYLFFVTLRHVKHQFLLKDILLSVGLDRLSIKKTVCELILANNSENVLILLDGFDEYPFTLDCQGLGHSTIVMTTRPWKYDVLLSQDNNFKVDAVSEVRGLTYRGIRELSRNVIVSYNKQSPDMGLNGSNAEEQTDIYLDDIKSAELSGSIRIPLILIITVLTWLENKQSLSKSLTCNILGLLKVIFQRGKRKLSQTDKQALKLVEQEKKEPSVFHTGITTKYKFMCDHQVLLQNLGRLAYKGLTDQQMGLSLVFSEDELHKFLDSEELEICYKLGLLTGSTVTTTFLGPPQVSISFYHKLIQELFAAIGIISSSDNNLSEVTKILTSLTVVLEMEKVILFITALNPYIGSDLSKHTAVLAETDDSACKDRRKGKSSYILENYSKLICKCMFEWDSIHDRKEQKPLYLTDLIVKSDFVRKLHLCTYLSRKQLKSLKVEVGSSESVNTKQMFSQLAKLTAEAAALQVLGIDVRLVKQEDINTTATTNFDLTENVKLERVSIKGITLSNGQHCLGLTFGKAVHLKKMHIENAGINTLYLQNITRLEMKNVKLREYRLPTGLKRLEYVKLKSVLMPGLSWHSFFKSLQSASLKRLILKNLNIDDITINLENSSGLVWLVLKDVKMKENRIPTTLKELKNVILKSVTMPGSSSNSFFPSLQSASLTSLILKNLNIDDITINLENSSGLWELELEDVKVREIRLPTGLKELKYVKLQSVTMPGSSWNSFCPSLQSASLTSLILKNLNIDHITINLENSSGLWELELEDVKMKETKLPTRLEKLKYVKLKSVTMPGSSWNSFFPSLQSASLTSLILKNLNIDDITINLENSSGLWALKLKDVNMKVIRLPARLKELNNVILKSVTMPKSSLNSFSQSLQSTSLTKLTLKNHNIDEIRLPNCERLQDLEISSMKLAEIHISSTKRLTVIKADKVALPESQASSFFNQVLFSTNLMRLTMQDITLGEETVQFDRWNPDPQNLRSFTRLRNFLIKLENVTMSKESYECLCTLLKTLEFNEYQVTKHSTDKEKTRHDISCESSARQRIHMKNQALFSSKDKSKTLKCHLLQYLFGALGVKGVWVHIHTF